jgi:hypothetical protein
MAPDLVRLFIAAFHAEAIARSAPPKRARPALRTEIATLERKIARLIAAIEDGLYDADLKSRFADLQARERAVERKFEATAPALPVHLHPNLAELYRRKVERLHECLNVDGTRAEAAEALRSTASWPPFWSSQTKRPPRAGETGVRLGCGGPQPPTAHYGDTNLRRHVSCSFAFRIILITELR